MEQLDLDALSAPRGPRRAEPGQGRPRRAARRRRSLPRLARAGDLRDKPPSALTGSAHLTAHVTGSPSQPDSRAALRAPALALGAGLRVDGLAIDGALSGPLRRPHGLLHIASTSLELADIGLGAPTIVAQVDGTTAHLQIDAAVGRARGDATQAEGALHLAGDARLDDDGDGAEFSGFQITWPGNALLQDQPTRLHLRAHETGARAARAQGRARGADLRGHRAPGAAGRGAAGEAARARRGQPAAAAVRARRAPAFVLPPDLHVAGLVDARVAFSGTTRAPEIAASLALHGVELFSLRGLDGELAVRLEHERLRSDGKLTGLAGGAIDWRFNLPSSLEAAPASPLELQLKCGPFDLTRLPALAQRAELFTAAPAGALSLDVTAQGTLEHPRATASLEASGVRWAKVHQLGARVELELADERAKLAAQVSLVDAPIATLAAEGPFDLDRRSAPARALRQGVREAGLGVGAGARTSAGAAGARGALTARRDRRSLRVARPGRDRAGAAADVERAREGAERGRAARARSRALALGGQEPALRGGGEAGRRGAREACGRGADRGGRAGGAGPLRIRAGDVGSAARPLALARGGGREAGAGQPPHRQPGGRAAGRARRARRAHPWLGHRRRAQAERDPLAARRRGRTAPARRRRGLPGGRFARARAFMWRWRRRARRSWARACSSRRRETPASHPTAAPPRTRPPSRPPRWLGHAANSPSGSSVAAGPGAATDAGPATSATSTTASSARSAQASRARAHSIQRGGGTFLGHATLQAPLAARALLDRGPALLEEGNLDAIVTARGLDLTFLSGLTPLLRSTGGVLDGEVVLHGLLDRIEPKGELHLRRGLFDSAGQGLFEDVAFDATFTPQEAVVDRFTGSTGGGTFSGTLVLDSEERRQRRRGRSVPVQRRAARGRRRVGAGADRRRRPAARVRPAAAAPGGRGARPPRRRGRLLRRRVGRQRHRHGRRSPARASTSPRCPTRSCPRWRPIPRCWSTSRARSRTRPASTPPSSRGSARRSRRATSASTCSSSSTSWW